MIQYCEIEKYLLVNLDKKEFTKVSMVAPAAFDRTQECDGCGPSFVLRTDSHNGTYDLVSLLPGGKGFTDQSLGHFSKLPKEMLALILSGVSDYVDLLFFSPAHNILFEIGYQILVSRILAAQTRSQAGDRLICLTDNSILPDLPPTTFTTSEYRALRSWYPNQVPGRKDIKSYYQTFSRYCRPVFDTTYGVLGSQTPSVASHSQERLKKSGALDWPAPEQWKPL